MCSEHSILDYVNSNDAQLATEKREVDLDTLLLQLKENMTEDEFLMPIRRGHTLEDALRSMQRSSFSPSLHLIVHI